MTPVIGLNKQESAKLSAAPTREEYLNRATHLLRERIFRPAGIGVPACKVSVGFPGASGRGGKVLGAHWHPTSSADGVSQIYISPILGNGYDAIDTLTHELVHAALPDAKHNKPFQLACEKIGLTKGKPKSASAGTELKARLETLVAELGAYPHAQLSLKEKPKQTTRLVKCQCEHCGYTVRTTAKWIEELGTPLCPCEYKGPKKYSRMATDHVAGEEPMKAIKATL